MAERDYNNIEKAAVILMSLGKGQASEVMKFLSESEVKKLSRAFMAVQEVERDAQGNIAQEFQRMLQAAERLVVDGKEFARDVISEAFGEDAGEGLLEYVTGSKKESLSVLMSDIPADIIDSFIQAEHPQTIAFLLTRMVPEEAAEMMAKLPEELQTDVLLRISQLDHVKTDVVDEVREVLRGQVRGLGLREEEEAGGPKAAADILNFVERTSEERIIMDLEDSHPELADEIRNLMFTFEDILKIDDRAVQSILKEVPRDQLVIALKTASAKLQDLLFKNVSQRAAQMIREDLETLGPMRLKDVEKAQQGVIDVVRRLEAEGKIAIGGGADEVLV